MWAEAYASSTEAGIRAVSKDAVLLHIRVVFAHVTAESTNAGILTVVLKTTRVEVTAKPMEEGIAARWKGAPSSQR